MEFHVPLIFTWFPSHKLVENNLLNTQPYYIILLYNKQTNHIRIFTLHHQQENNIKLFTLHYQEANNTKMMLPTRKQY